MEDTADIIASRREEVLGDYNAAVLSNRRRFKENDEKATSEYIFENQIIDANAIVQEFSENNRRVVSITKKTKVGMDGLMIQIATLMTTHPDDFFVVNPANVRIITGMNNAGWEKDMKEKSPNIFKDKIFHHGQLRKANLNNLRNALIIIDEIDTGDKEKQVLHDSLYEANLLDMNYVIKNNIRFVVDSATMLKELYDLYQWGNLHKWYQMTIPPSYIGHADFLKRGILKEFYPLTTLVSAETWIQEDILDRYDADYRVHLIRVNPKTIHVLQSACIRKQIAFRNHTSTDRLSAEEIKELFKEPLKGHIVLGVKGFFRRANLIPNEWKKRIGATHELYTKVVDNNVQIQGLPGRMTGYWRDIIEGGHKTGPHRTSIKAVEEYEKAYNDPFGLNSYQSAGFKKKAGKVYADPTMISPKNIVGLVAIDVPVIEDPTDPRTIPVVLQITEDEYASIKRLGKEWDDASIYTVIEKYNNGIVKEMLRIKANGGKDQIVQPAIDATTYKVYITDFINAAHDKKRMAHVGNIKNKQIDTFQIYLDSVEKRIIINL